MLSLLIISNNPKAELIQSFIQSQVENKITLVADFESGLNEVLDQSPDAVIIQGQIDAVACDAIARYVKQMLGADAPRFIMLHEGAPVTSPAKGLYDGFVNLNQPDEALLTEIGSRVKRISDGDQVIDNAADIPLPSLPDTPAEELPPASPETAIRPLHVLLVEDNIIGQRVALTILNNLGCGVDIVADGQRAISALEQIDYDMVLMDWMMPRLDGLEATARIRNKESKVLNHDVPIIAVTSNIKPGDRETCLAAGMNDYLPKPLKKADLAAVIEKWTKKPDMDSPADLDTPAATPPEQGVSRDDDTGLQDPPPGDKPADETLPPSEVDQPPVTEEPEQAETKAPSKRKKQTKSAKPEADDESADDSSESDKANRQPHVLLVEDNLIGQRVALTMLNNLGCKVDVVPDGQKAITALESINYDMVLMDWNMPRMDGMQATAHVRDKQSNVINHSVPIIALTANTKPGDRDKCLAAGMNDYLEKPVKKAYLAEIIEKWLKNPEAGKQGENENLRAVSPSDEPLPALPAEPVSSKISEQLAESQRKIEALEQTITEKTFEMEAVREELQAESDRLKAAEEALEQARADAESANSRAEDAIEQMEAESAGRKDAEEALSMVRTAAESANSEAEAAIKEMQAERDELQQLKNSLELTVAERISELQTANELLQAEQAARKEAEEKLDQARMAAETLNKQVEVVNEYLQEERDDRDLLETRLKQADARAEFRTRLLVFLLSAVTVLCVAVGWYLFNKEPKSTSPVDRPKTAAPTAPTAPTATTAPAAPAGQTAPTTPTAPASPASPAGQTAPTTPTAPAAPAGQTAPAAPAAPTAQTAPAAPAPRQAPATPAAPAAPAAPAPRQAPAAPAPAARQTPAAGLPLPSFVSLSGRDSKFPAGNPGWERYVDAKHDIRIFKDTGNIKAVQVLAKKDQVISESFMRSAVREVVGSNDYKPISSEVKEGYVIQRSSIDAGSRLIVYSKQPSSNISAFVIQFE